MASRRLTAFLTFAVMLALAFSRPLIALVTHAIRTDIHSLCTRLHALGLRAIVLESCHVGKHAKTYARPIGTGSPRMEPID